ncbi:MAG: chemotaxis protein CheC [Clostridia bacterium]
MSAWPFGMPSWDRLEEIVPRACTLASESLSAFAEEPVRVEGIEVDAVAWQDLPTFLRSDPTDPAVSAMLGIEGANPGTIALVLSVDAAEGLAGLMLGEAHAVALDDLARSALAEVANITGATFLNTLAETLDSRLVPTVPHVLEAPLQVILERMIPPEVRDTEHIPVVNTVFQIGAQAIAGFLLIFPEIVFAG